MAETAATIIAYCLFIRFTLFGLKDSVTLYIFLSQESSGSGKKNFRLKTGEQTSGEERRDHGAETPLGGTGIRLHAEQHAQCNGFHQRVQRVRGIIGIDVAP